MQVKVKMNMQAFESHLHSLSAFQISTSKVVTMPKKTIVTRYFSYRLTQIIC